MDPVTEIVFPLYEKYHLPEHHTQGENCVFTPKIGDLTENVRLEGPKKQAISLL